MKRRSFELIKRCFNIFLIFVIICSLNGCKKEEVAVETAVKPVKEVKSVNAFYVQNDEFQPVFNISGTIKAQTETTIASETAGVISQILFTEGDEVNTGDYLLFFDSSDSNAQVNFETAQNSFLNAQKTLELTRISTENIKKSSLFALEQARLSYTNAKKAHENTKVSINEQINSSQSSVENAKINLDLAQKNLTDLQSNLEKSEKDLIENAEDTFSSSIVVFFNSLETVDSIVGISEKHENDNNYFAGTFSARDVSLVLKIKNLFIPTNYNFTATKEKINQIQDLSSAVSTLEEMRTFGNKIRDILDLTDSALQNTPITANIAQTQLDALKSQIYSLKSSLQTQVAASTSVCQSISSFIIEKPQQIASQELALKSAQSQYEQAEANLKNLKASLKIQESSTLSQMQIAEKALFSAKNTLQSTERSNEISIQSALSARDSTSRSLQSASLSLSKLRVESPVDGTILEKLVENGDTVSLGKALFVIADINRLLLKGDLSIDNAQKITTSNQVEVFINDQKIEQKVNISKIFPSADAETRRVSIEIEIDNNSQKIIPNSFARADIKGEKEENIIKIPLSSLFSKTPPEVFVIDSENKTVKKRQVVLGRSNKSFTEVLNGLEEGELIIEERVVGLENGEKVEILNLNNSAFKNSDAKDNLLENEKIKNEIKDLMKSDPLSLEKDKVKTSKSNDDLVLEKLGLFNLAEDCQENICRVDLDKIKQFEKFILESKNNTQFEKNIQSLQDSQKITKKDSQEDKALKARMQKELEKLKVEGNKNLTWIFQPSNKKFFKTKQKEFYIRGFYPKGTKKIFINNYKLQKFDPSFKVWNYFVSINRWNNLKKGTNDFKVQFISANNKIIGQENFSIFVEDLPN